jgi:hypothetical protein
MLETESNRHQVLSDGRTVWVNGPDGCSVGRFSAHGGIDVHRPAEEQRTLGACLFCKPGPSGPEDYKQFVRVIEDLFGVAIDARHRPTTLTQLSSPRSDAK